MRFLFYLLLLFALPTAVRAQSKPGRYKFTGYIYIPGSAPSTYIAEYNLSAKGDIDGYTLTGSRDGVLKAKLVGRVERNGNVFIKETESLDEKPLTGMYYCFFSAYLAKGTHDGKVVYSGKFESYQTNGNPCEGGTMVLTDVTPLPPVPKPKPKPVPPPPPPPSPPPPPPPPPPPSPKPVSATPPAKPVEDTVAVVREAPQSKPAPVPKPVPKPIQPAAAPLPVRDTLAREPLFVWQSDSLVMEIWDGYEEDGDVISLSFDGEEILHHYKLLRNGKRRLSFYLSPGKVHHLQIRFWEAGNIPPNTPSIIFTDGQTHMKRALSGRYGEKLDIWFVRKKQ